MEPSRAAESEKNETKTTQKNETETKNFSGFDYFWQHFVILEGLNKVSHVFSAYPNKIITWFLF